MTEKRVHLNRRRSSLVLLFMVGTFLVTRTVLYFQPHMDLYVGPYNIHHMFTGVLLLALFGISLVLLEGQHRLLDVNASGFGIGLGLALDEWVYLIVTDGTNLSYLAPVSFWGGIAAISLASVYIALIQLAYRARSGRAGSKGHMHVA